MVKIGLQIKATLSNIDKLYPHQPEQFCWPVKVQCTGCGENNPNWHLVSLDEVVQLTNGEAHFLYKCKCCSRENHMSILPANQVTKGGVGQNKKLLDTVYLDGDEDTFKTIISFECRGLQLTEFEARDGWAVQSGQKLFVDVDLTDKEWCEYNDLDNKPVEITNFQYKFVSLK